MTDRLTDAYVARRPNAAALHARARGLFAAQGATHFARVRAPFRPYIVKAQGSRKWDVDGQQYIDYVMGHGALILGHGHPAIVAAVEQQAVLGIHYGDNHPLEIEWAERIRRAMPSAERVEYFASGQEANQMGIRVARAFTGRKGLLKLQGNYHGWADELCPPGSAGAREEQVVTVAANDLAVLERELATERHAILLVEGGGSRIGGRAPLPAEYFQALPGLTSRYGTLLMLDEVVTGFREAEGGWQEVVGIKPDLTSVGKAVSGGLPSGALLGRSEVMATLDPSSGPERAVIHGGTWNALPITCAAGIAALDLYRGGGPQRAARASADRFRTLANQALRELGSRARVYGRSVVHLYLGEIDREPPDDLEPPTTNVARLLDPSMTPAYKRLDLHLLQRGVASMRGEGLIFSTAHTEADVEETVAALRQSVAAMMEEGSIPQGS